jgi:FtsZ-interacting cell division protein ZipA
MTTVWAILIIVAVLLVASLVYVGWRDRRRLSSADDQAASRTAASEAERHAAERHGQQGGVWDHGRIDGQRGG